MLFQMRYDVLFRQFRLLTAQAGSIPAAIRLIFENCYRSSAGTGLDAPVLLLMLAVSACMKIVNPPTIISFHHADRVFDNVYL